MTSLRAQRLPSALALLVAIVTLLWASIAQAFTPPPINGHVMDTAGVLTSQQVLQLDAKLERARVEKGFAVVVFLPKSLQGESVEDVAYTTFNTWKVGSAKGDDGVLLVIAPNDRQEWIETGKGVGGALTDIGSSHINRETIIPLLKQGLFYEAVDKGTDAILESLTTGTPGGASDPGKKPGARATQRSGDRGPAAAQPASPLKMVGLAGVVLLVIILAIVSPTFRQILFFFLLFGRGGGGFGGGGGGGGGGPGYGGGGGSSGGGGSGDGW